MPEGEYRRHHNGAVGIAQVTVAVADVQDSLARYRSFLGDDAVRGGDILLEGARIALVQDTSRARDPGPCSMLLRGPGDDPRGVRPLELPFLR